MYKFKFADIGEGLHEGVVGTIYKKVGDKVEEGDNLFAVETDKAASDIPSPTTGVVTQVLMKEGDTIHVGDVVYHIDDGKSDETAPSSPETTAPTQEKKGAAVVGEIEVSDELLSFPTRKPAPVKEMVSVSPDIVPDSYEQVDVFVVGAGPGGYLAGELAAKSNLKTIVVEKEKPGGVCLNWGCIPTKTLLKSAKLHHDCVNAKNYGVNLQVNSVRPDWQGMQTRKNTVTKQLSFGVKTLLKAAGAEYLQGEAVVVDANTVRVGARSFKTKHLVIATGSHPITLNMLPGFEQATKNGLVINSTGALELTQIPDSIVIIGGGVIGLEFATLYNELGSKVTIIEGLNRILPPVDLDVSALATKIAVSRGIKIFTSAKVTGIDGNKVLFEFNGQKQTITAEKVLVSVGRRPSSKNIVENIGVKTGARGEIIVDKAMRTNVPGVYAIGDVVGQAMLAHTAYNHAKVVVQTILGNNPSSTPGVSPAVIYTFPEIASIGQTEEELKENNTPYLMVKIQNTNLGKALADGSTQGFAKLLFGKEFGEIYGCHIVDPVASELISEIGLLMGMEGTIFDLNAVVHPHPSFAESIGELAVKAIFKNRSST